MKLSLTTTCLALSLLSASHAQPLTPNDPVWTDCVGSSAFVDPATNYLAFWLDTAYGMSNNLTGTTLTNTQIVNYWYSRSVPELLNGWKRYAGHAYATYRTDGPSGYPYLHCDVPDGGYYHLIPDPAQSGSKEQPLTFIGVIRVLNWYRGGWPSGGIIHLNGDFQHAESLDCFTSGGVDKWGFSINGTYASSVTGVQTNQWLVLTMIYNGTDSLLRTNGTAILSGNAGTGHADENLIFGFGNNDGRYSLDFDLIEMRLYHTLVSTNDVQAIENDLRSKYGF